MDELKPCPFCGCKAVAENYIIEAQVVCLGCRVKIVRSHGAKDDNGLPESITAWNTRTPDPGASYASRAAEGATAITSRIGGAPGFATTTRT